MLGYLQSVNDNVELRLFVPSSGRDYRLELRPDPPQVVLWRTDKPEAVTVGSVGVYSIRYLMEGAVPGSIGEPAPTGYTPRDGWISSAGSIFIVASSASRAGTTPCSLFEVPPEGRWRVASPASATPEGDDDCAAYADRHRPEGSSVSSVSSADMLRRQTCAAAGSVCDALGQPRFAKMRSAIMKADRSVGDLAVAEAKPDRPGSTRTAPFDLAIAVAVGDTPHLLARTWLVDRRDGRLRPLNLPPARRQLQAAVEDHFVLLADEYSGANPVLIDLDRGQKIFSPRLASSAVWIPMLRTSN